MYFNLSLYTFILCLASSPTRPLYPPPSPPPTRAPPIPKQRRLSFFERITGNTGASTATETNDDHNTYNQSSNTNYDNINSTNTNTDTNNSRITSTMTGGYGNDTRRKLTLFTGSTYNNNNNNNNTSTASDPNNSLSAKDVSYDQVYQNSSQG